MRRLAALLLLLALAACGGGSSAPRAATQASLHAAVYDYTANLLGGSAEAAWSGLSDRCQREIGHDTYISTAQDAAGLYKGLTVTSYRVDSFSPPHARVTYTTAVTAVAKSDQPWLYENGAWRWDDC